MADPKIYPREADWPRDDDWERITCTQAGQPHHVQCGWCYAHGHPKFQGCPVVEPEQPA